MNLNNIQILCRVIVAFMAVFLFFYVWNTDVSMLGAVIITVVAGIALIVVLGFVAPTKMKTAAEINQKSAEINNSEKKLSVLMQQMYNQNDQTELTIEPQSEKSLLINHIKTAIWEVLNMPVFPHAIECLHSSTSLDIVGIIDLFDEPLRREINQWYQLNMMIDNDSNEPAGELSEKTEPEKPKKKRGRKRVTK